MTTPTGNPASVPDVTPAQQARRFWGVALLLVIALAVLYVPTAWHPFLNLDDQEYVSSNDVIKQGLTLRGVQYAFGLEHWAWHPLTSLSFMLEVELFGVEPGPMHVTNMLLHMASTLLLLSLLVRMTGKFWRAAAVTALFALHPLRVESVAWVCERKDVLAMALGLATMHLYVSYARLPSVRRYLAVLGCFALSLMAKATFVTLPFLLLLVDLWPLGRLKNAHAWLLPAGKDEHRAPPASQRTLSQLVLEKLPLLALAIAAIVLLLLAAHKDDALRTSQDLDAIARLQNAVVAYTQYLRLMLWPAHLAVVYMHPGHWPLSQVLLSASVLGVLSLAAAMQARRQPAVLLGWLWFLGTLVPMVGLVQSGPQAYADRFTYLPSIGFTLALVWLLAEAWDSCSRSLPRSVRTGVPAALVLIASAALAVTTARQVSLWSQNEKLWRHTEAVTSRNVVARVKLGSMALDAGRHEEALQWYERAQVQRMQKIELLADLFELYVKTQRPQQATQVFEELTRLPATTSEHELHLGLAKALAAGVYRKPEFVLQAEQHFRRALVLRPNWADGYNNLGISLAMQNRLAEAEAAFTEALRLSPRLEDARRNLERVQAQRRAPGGAR